MHARATTIVFMLAMLGCPGEQDMPPEGDTSTGDASGPSTTEEPTGTESGTVDESGTGDACLGPDGCYDCEPMESEELLNHCTAADCEPFQNTQDRLPRLEADSSLPPIP